MSFFASFSSSMDVTTVVNAFPGCEFVQEHEGCVYLTNVDQRSVVFLSISRLISL